MAHKVKQYCDGTTAYRGYVIRYLLSNSYSSGHARLILYHVSKDGFHICYAPSFDRAMSEIDGLLDTFKAA